MRLIAQPYTVLRTNLQADLLAVQIAGNGHVYIGGNTGTLAKSTDQGNTWTAMTMPLLAATDTVVDIQVLGNDTLLVFTRHKLLTSVDGWATVNVQQLPFRSAVRKASVTSASKIWLSTSTEPSGLFKSQDGGRTWDSVAVAAGSIASFLEVKFANESVGFAVGGNFRPGTRDVSVYRTTDAGLSWDSITTFPRGLPGFNQQWAVYAKNPSTWFTVGAKNMICTTTDTGRSWTLLTTVDNSQPYIRSIGGSGDTILAFGEEGYSRAGYYSRDGAQVLRELSANWVTQSQNTLTGNQRRLVATAYRNRVGYSVAGRGAVIRLTAQSMGFITSLGKQPITTRNAAWPNPAVAGQAITVEAEAVTSNQAVLTNALGQERTAAIETNSPNRVTVILPADLSTGIYQLRIGSLVSKLVIR